MQTLDAADLYHQDRHVCARVAEFLGGDCPDNLTSHFITANDHLGANSRRRSPAELFHCMEQGMEICRSLWDRDSLLAHLDVEYVNFDFPGEVYLNPDRIFALQAPVIATIEKLLTEYGIAPLHILSGRGHHFVWKVPQISDVFEKLVTLGGGEPSALQVGVKSHSSDGAPIPPPRLTEAFAGLGLVMELLAHEIKELSAPHCDLPVELTALEVGPSACGREMISIDISEYGDPLQTRLIRVPFSVYLKPWQQRELIGCDLVRSLSPIYFIPLHDMPLAQGIHVMRDQQLVMELADHVTARIPDQPHGTTSLVAKYEASSLRLFHLWFYSLPHSPPGGDLNSYDDTPLDPLPPCARLILAAPNDLLLRPSGMRLITRALLSLGWHPRHIAGLIRSKFEHDYGWGDQWMSYDPAMRADFYTRLFAGLFVTRRDDLVDFNCYSSNEEGTCPLTHCPGNLDWFRQSALARRHYGYLAHRPFNRLFLPTEHL